MLDNGLCFRDRSGEEYGNRKYVTEQGTKRHKALQGLIRGRLSPTPILA